MTVTKAVRAVLTKTLNDYNTEIARLTNEIRVKTTDLAEQKLLLETIRQEAQEISDALQ